MHIIQVIITLIILARSPERILRIRNIRFLEEANAYIVAANCRTLVLDSQKGGSNYEFCVRLFERTIKASNLQFAAKCRH